MATPISASMIVQLLKEWDIPFKEYKDWQNHNRNHKGLWGPVQGFMVHHTGSDNKDQRDVLYDGLVNLPGPLCQFGLDQEGVVHLIGWGRCNHAGLGDSSVLQAVINEDYAWDVDLKPQHADIDGNARFYGVETWYSGEHAMPEKMYFSLMRLSAMICTYHGWGARSVIGHGEWQPGKWDPGYKRGLIMDMSYFRGNVRKAIANGKNLTPVDPPKIPVPPVAKTIEQRVKSLEDRVSKLEK